MKSTFWFPQIRGDMAFVSLCVAYFSYCNVAANDSILYCLLIMLIVSFTDQKFSVLMKSALWIFFHLMDHSFTFSDSLLVLEFIISCYAT